MTEIESKDLDAEFQWYVAGFLDLLGQSAVLEQIKDLPEEKQGPEFAQFVELVKKSFGLVNVLHDAFQSHVSAVSEESDFVKSLPARQREIFRHLGSRQITMRRFSDGLVAFFSVKEEVASPVLAVVSSVWGLLAGCASSFLVFLEQGYPLRGGIDLGIGLEYHKGELYGPAVQRAYKLESSTAQYPRIVLGKELCNYLAIQIAREIPASTSDDEKVMLGASKMIASRCQRMIARDVDGQMILDYLGDTSRKVFEESGLGATAANAHQYVLKQLNEAKQRQDFKLASRYLMLHSYFSARLPKWQRKS